MLQAIRHKKERLIVGLMSGSSADGIDAALVKVSGSGKSTAVHTIAHDTLRFSGKIRELILKCSHPDTSRVDDICRLNSLLGELFAQAVVHIAKKADCELSQIDLIGSHGQTIHHLPSPEKISGVEVTSTLQIGEPSIIAERTGITTIADFRPRDMAAGGQGAPLVSYVEYLLFSHPEKSRVALNIGGIANITVLPAGSPAEEVFAMDTGPGNILLDQLIYKITGGKNRCDLDGKRARQGKVNQRILERLLEHPFLQNPPPKSTGREDFGKAYLHWIMEMGKGTEWDDLITTIAEFTVRTIVNSLEMFVFPYHEIDELIVSGGGVRNFYIWHRLEESLPQQKMLTSDDFSIPSDVKEAVAFAILANETLMGHEGNLPGATGARHRVILGKITPGKNI
ncbi:MAG: anhydro-N-acetylmuramic acid kinase [Acidobacteriota bacterium]